MINNPLEDIILLVDDEAIIRDSLRQWLELEGFGVVTAASGEEALQICKTEPIDVGVFDIRMPGMDGITLLSHVKHHCPDMAVIMMTAFASIEDAVRCISQGAYDYIIKPFPPEKLSQTIHHIIEMHRLRHQCQETRNTTQIVTQFLKQTHSYLHLGIATALLSGAKWRRPAREPMGGGAGGGEQAHLVDEALVAGHDALAAQTCTLKELAETTLVMVEMLSERPARLLCRVADDTTPHSFPLAPVSLALQMICLYAITQLDTQRQILFCEDKKPGQSPALQILIDAPLPAAAQSALTEEIAAEDFPDKQLCWAGTMLRSAGIQLKIEATDDQTAVSLLASR